MAKNTPKTQQLIDKIKAELTTGKFSLRQIARSYGVGDGYVAKVRDDKAQPLVTATTPKCPEADPTDSRILQLESKITALSDERNRLSKAYKAAQRKNSIFEAVVDEMQQVVEPIKPLPKAPKLKKVGKQIHESCVLHLSDEHADQIILPHQVNNLERYNFGIALRRAEELVDTTLKFTQHTLSNYCFDTLWIFANGDHVSGEIHSAVEHSEYRNMFKNSFAVGQMHALILRDFAPHFKDVKIIYTAGNHGRRTLKKDYHGAHDNWDYLVARVAQLHCKDIENVEFLIPDSFSANIEIEGHGFCIAHGDDIRAWSGIPWYGIERKTRRWLALNAAIDRKIHYYCFGHFHNTAMQANLNGETIINGSWVACDPYVINALTTYNVPKQWLHGVHPNRGVSWRLGVNLKSSREHLGPQRYSVALKDF